MRKPFDKTLPGAEPKLKSRKADSNQILTKEDQTFDLTKNVFDLNIIDLTVPSENNTRRYKTEEELFQSNTSSISYERIQISHNIDSNFDILFGETLEISFGTLSTIPYIITDTDIISQTPENFLRKDSINIHQLLVTSGVDPSVIEPLSGVIGNLISAANVNASAVAKRLPDISAYIEKELSPEKLRHPEAAAPSASFGPSQKNTGHAPAAPSAEPEPLAGGPALPSHPLPTSPDEARAMGILAWHDAESLGHSIVDHLRNTETGYGRWTRQPPGLPIRSLHECDPQAHRKLYNWLGPNESINKIPEDIFISGRRKAPVIISDEAGIAARNLARQWERQKQKGSNRS